MAQREFANQTALVAYAEQNDLAYEYEYTPAFAKWQRLLSPEQYEIVEARTSRGVSRVMIDAGRVAAGPGKALDKTKSDWVLGDCQSPGTNCPSRQRR